MMNSMIEPTTTSVSNLPCQGCGGTGVQRNQQTGMNEICPVCGGTGKMRNQYPITY